MIVVCSYISKRQDVVHCVENFTVSEIVKITSQHSSAIMQGT